ncbi:uncharacterized protein LOC143230570 isoform X4 [Tachypleus tridentatus]|uniref:uncharacterized protein LOC143230570 isoform X4 n=1 Tax=Tachypleus tridentatus TaxID=6853 RepID=UPI003FD56DC1
MFERANISVKGFEPAGHKWQIECLKHQAMPGRSRVARTLIMSLANNRISSTEGVEYPLLRKLNLNSPIYHKRTDGKEKSTIKSLFVFQDL